MNIRLTIRLACEGKEEAMNLPALLARLQSHIANLQTAGTLPPADVRYLVIPGRWE